jgi:hypothetical protein
MDKPADAAELEFQSKAKKLSGNNLIAHQLNGIRLAIKEQVKWTAAIDSDLKAGLAAVALAASTPNDNSAEVQKQIDQFTQQLKTGTDELEAAVKANQPKIEGDL